LRDEFRDKIDDVYRDSLRKGEENIDNLENKLDYYYR
jgi:hypothetical protein